MSDPAAPATPAFRRGRTAAIIPAAGRGERLGAGMPKALVTVGGTPLVTLAVQALGEARSVDIVIVAAPFGHLDAMVDLLHDDLELHGTELVLVLGGDTRQESVRLALEAIEDEDDVDVVLVHDAARPLMPVSVIDAVTAAVRAGAPAVVPAIAVVDTVKRIDAAGVVEETLDRSVLRAVQTPQGFRRDVLERAHAAGVSAATDDAGLVEAMGVPVLVIPGSEDGFKVTRPFDLMMAETRLDHREIVDMVDREVASWPGMQALRAARAAEDLTGADAAGGEQIPAEPRSTLATPGAIPATPEPVGEVGTGRG